ncbi:ABC transporter ATP-binding protein [Candidatus Bathyarchaeota archaeon]|nr:ABC transporter ATP-binding protein [Candidatus Bathyarchaeota archaeon]
MPSIEAINLSKKYGSFAALSDLNLNIEGAKCVGFLGPNGAGKSTTLKLFTDLIRPSAGEALINGANVHTDKKRALGSVGALIEIPEIYPALTPREALMMIAEIRGIPKNERKEQVAEAVSEVRMEEWINKRVGKFSKGMKQRICVASALLSDPSIVLLDEPTTGLDPRGMSEVRDIIKSLKNKKRLIFMSSHLLSEVSDVCDEVAIIDHGKLIIYDTLSNVTAKVSDGENVVEVELRNTVNAELTSKIAAKIPGINKAEKSDDTTFRIKFTGGLNAQERILADLVKMNIGIVSYKPASSALEEAYLSLVKSTL